jgi:hypothetical protein
MKSYYDMLQYLVDRFPYQRKTSASWLVPTAIGVGLGVAAGVGIGMLFAPAPGIETRRQLKDRSSQLKDKAFSAAHQAKDRISNQLGAASNHVAERSFANDMGEIR